MSDDNILQVDIISPEKPVYQGDALSVIAVAHDGELGILPGHAPMVTKLGIGEVRITRGTSSDSVTDRFAIKQGYLEVMNNKVVVLSEDAKAIKDLRGIDKEELERLQKELETEKDPSRREEIAADISWMKACEKLYADTK